MTGVGRFPFDYEQSRIILLHPVPGVTPYQADGSEVTQGSEEEIRPVHWEEFVNRSMSRDFVKWARHLFLE